ncbi:HNH endonuclease [Ralstonia phage BOESR1]|nr:HNH endonuclease [Ralstonia phage BOESR1]
MFIDHVDGDRTNNRLSNLRLCTHAQNQLNRGVTRNNTTGFKGVRPSNGRFRADIQVDGRREYLGHFDTAREAAEEYDLHARRLHGQFARTNEVMGLL